MISWGPHSSLERIKVKICRRLKPKTPLKQKSFSQIKQQQQQQQQLIQIDDTNGPQYTTENQIKVLTVFAASKTVQDIFFQRENTL